MPHSAFTTWQVFDETGRRKYLSELERTRFLLLVSNLPVRYGALCKTLAFTGCRISEALALCRHQLDAERRTLTFRTLKRRRIVFRTVPVPQSLIEDLLALPERADQRFWGIHRATAWRVVKAVMALARVEGPMACCKGLRHCFGMHAAGKNVPPNLIQRWMGHSSPVTTAVYLDAIGIEEREFAERMW
jgi:integrase